MRRVPVPPIAPPHPIPQLHILVTNIPRLRHPLTPAASYPGKPAPQRRPQTMATLLTGAAFGAALTAAGVHDPAVLISQFKFENFDMLQSFLAASATTR